MTGSGWALVGLGSPGQCCVPRGQVGALVDLGGQSRLWNDHDTPVAHRPRPLLLQCRREQSHTAGIMSTRSAWYRC